MTNKELDHENALLRREFGSASNGDPKYRWTRAGEMEYLSFEGKYDWTANADGLLVPTKVFVKRKLRPDLDDRQWVLTKWIDGGKEAAIVFQFGKSLYAFVLELGLNVEPSTMHRGHSFTEFLIGYIREELKKSDAEAIRQALDKADKSEKDTYNRLHDDIGDTLTAFANVPGSHGHHVEFMSGFGPTKEKLNGNNDTGTQNHPVSLAD